MAKKEGAKMKVLVMLLLFVSQIYSQTTYEIPFSTKGNSIELKIKNSSSIKTEGVEISATGTPNWLNFKEESRRIEVLKGGEEKAVEFKFSVDKTAPVQEAVKLKFKITDKRGESWEKEITVEVSPPKEFKLYRNYPNPFNPSTTISYTIPTSQNPPFAKGGNTRGVFVVLKIYDILGREVSTLVNREQKPGFYKVNWLANNFASGMYIYRILAKYGNGETKIQQRKMLLMK